MQYIVIKPVPPPDVPYVHGRAPTAGNQSLDGGTIRKFLGYRLEWNEWS